MSVIPVAPRPLSCRGLLGLALLLGVWAGTAGAADALPGLVREYQAVLGDRSDRAYATQRRVLTEIADLDTPEARKQLHALLKRYGFSDRTRGAHLLRAIVRRGEPKDADAVIRWVELRRDPLLLESLGSILADAQRPSVRAHLRGDALRRAAPEAKAQILGALGALGEKEAALAILPVLRTENLRVRVEALGALGQLQDERALTTVQVFLRHDDPRVRDAAARALGMLGSKRARTALAAALDDADRRVVESAATALGLLGEPASIPVLIGHLAAVGEDDLRLADAYASALQRITGRPIGTDAELWRRWWDVVKDQPLEKHEAPPGGATAAGVRYYGFPVRSSRAVFVLDVSRSMGWNDRLPSAKTELKRVLAKLPERTHFNVLAYSDDVHSWRSKLTAATRSNVKRASSFVGAQRPLNGTNTHDALATAFRDPEVDTVFLLSDGHPSRGAVIDPDLILAAVRNWNRYRRVRVHCIALMRGDPPRAFGGNEDRERATRFMQQLAAENGGRFQEIR